VERLLESLRDGRNLIALVGPSGSGKSSVIAAGLIPRLREDAIEGSEHWVIASMVPGTNPLAEVEAVIAASTDVPQGLARLLDPDSTPARRATDLRTMPRGARLLVVIDQFEELFTLTDDTQRQRFLTAIAGAVTEPGTQITVLLALRADYYDRPLHHPEFARVFAPGVVNVLPMTAHELEAAVVGPAGRAGLSVEPALLAELVADAAHRPGTLPLLEYALTELFDQRTDASLTLDGYRVLGGIRGVLSRSAEALYNSLSAEERHVAMQVFLRLVQLGHGTTESRRRLPLADLTGLDLDPVSLSKVLETFGQRRLLSFDRDAATDQATVEVAHESLFREWERLADWIDRHRTALRRYESFMGAADEWEANGRHPDYLLTGTRLTEFEASNQEGTLQITGRLREFMAGGIARREAEQAAARAQAESQRRLERRARWRLAALAAVIAVTVGGLGLAAWAGVFANAKEVALVHEGTGEFDLLSEAGFDLAVAEFGLRGEEFLFEEKPDNVDAKVAELLELTAAGPELVIVGGGSWPVVELAQNRPNVRWISRDRIDDLPNVAYWDYFDHEGAYLAGVVAALRSRTGTIGFVGGYDGWFIWTFHGGYIAGARSVAPDIEVLSAYLSVGADFSGFHNAGAAEREASRMYEAGADIVFHASGDSGVGVFEAATALSTPDRHLWAIGVDSDQYETVLQLPGAVHPEEWRRHILTSVLKHLDLVNYVFLADFAQGRFTPGGRTFGLASGVFDISYSGGYIEDLRPQIEAARAAIVADEVLVPCVPPEREAQAAEAGWVSTEASCSR
jgi:basic membrane lipoprotein Med (substrate-binding protein (PBP1-ABC) superfamily)